MNIIFKLRMPNRNQSTQKAEQGFSLLEVLVAVSLLAISGLAISTSTIHALRSLKLVELNHIASSLAISKMEEIAAKDTIDMDSSLNQSESAVDWPGTSVTFSRATTVSINGDGSRTVVVQVNSNDLAFPTGVTFRNTYSLWE